MPLIYDKDGWLFENPQENIVHDITIDEINQLLNYAEQDEMWAAAVKNEVANRDKAIRDGTYTKKTDWLIEEFQIMQTSGTVVQMPFGPRIITFPSKRQLFRGEIQNYHRSIPSLNRMLKDGMDEKEKETIRTIAHLRKWQFANLLSNINIVPYWEAKLSDVNFDALAQHYGLATHLMDLTNDFKAALFFATCKYVQETDSYRPLTQEDIDKSEDTKYGYIFHAPDWTIDFMNGGGFMKWEERHHCISDPNMSMKKFYLQSGDMDGVALQIGYQPLQRCAQQSGYIYPMRNESSLQEDWHFEKMRFKQSVEVSQQVYEMMDGGKKVFPNEGVNELRDYIEQIKHSVVFTKDELEAVYDCDGIDKTIFPTISDLEKALVGYTTSDGAIEIQDEPIVYQIPTELLDTVNSHYDGKDLLEAIGGMIHQKYPDQEYRKQRYMDIYGKLI
ncbi:MAG: FRG domain-containing protein [Agathobacter sp.]|nr:FRG domain-containing protein [Agathobacter sp.]